MCFYICNEFNFNLFSSNYDYYLNIYVLFCDINIFLNIDCNEVFLV